jgi:hypothetical protein
LIEAACEPGDIFQDPSVGAVDRNEIREAQGKIDSHLTALEALKVHPINGIEHGTFMLLLNAVNQAYDLSSADDSDDPNDPIVRAHRDATEALRFIHSFLYPDIGCPCEDDPADCAHRHFNPQTGKCLECPGYAAESLRKDDHLQLVIKMTAAEIEDCAECEYINDERPEDAPETPVNEGEFAVLYPESRDISDMEADFQVCKQHRESERVNEAVEVGARIVQIERI